MEVELERTFLLRKIPKGLKDCRSIEIFDIYIPRSVAHPILRIRKRGDVFEMTKKSPIENDSSEQREQTIPLSKEEFSELSILEGKKLRKIRYFYPVGNKIAEIDFYLDDLKGLATADFEFDSVEEKKNFVMPDFCLAEVTREEFAAAGYLAGKKYEDIQSFLKKYNYQRFKGVNQG